MSEEMTPENSSIPQTKSELPLPQKLEGFDLRKAVNFAFYESDDIPTGHIIDNLCTKIEAHYEGKLSEACNHLMDEQKRSDYFEKQIQFLKDELKMHREHISRHIDLD